MAQFISGVAGYRFVQVDASRLLLLLARFAGEVGADARALRTFPSRAVAQHFTPEYYLQKLDFLVRYPGYLAYEIMALHKAGHASASDRGKMLTLVRGMIADREPEILTLPYQRFWHGAYERLDDVESWWYSLELVYTCQESRGGAPPQKHYFVTKFGLEEADRLISEVPHARWYASRINLVHGFFGHLTPSEVRNLQYRHSKYRDAQLGQTIPDLTPEEIDEASIDAFEEPLGVNLD